MVSLSLWCIVSDISFLDCLFIAVFCLIPSSLLEQFVPCYCVQKCTVSFCSLFTWLHKMRIRCLSIFLSAERHGLRLGTLVQFFVVAACVVLRPETWYGLILIMLWVHFVTLLVCRSFVSSKQLFWVTTKNKPKSESNTVTTPSPLAPPPPPQRPHPSPRLPTPPCSSFRDLRTKCPEIRPGFLTRRGGNSESHLQSFRSHFWSRHKTISWASHYRPWALQLPARRRLWRRRRHLTLPSYLPHRRKGADLLALISDMTEVVR